MDSNYWEKEWTSLEKIKNHLENTAKRVEIQYQDEGFGTPEYVYYLDKTIVTLKDSTLGTCYVDSCKNCEKYPCQSGIVSMILTSDGKLKLCSLSDEYEINLKPFISNLNASRKELRDIIERYNEAEFHNLWWQNMRSTNQ